MAIRKNSTEQQRVKSRVWNASLRDMNLGAKELNSVGNNGKEGIRCVN
jgi:hypothetical protein